MSAHTEHDDAVLPPQPPATDKPFGAGQLLWIVALAAAGALLTKSVDHALPIVVAIAVAALIPRSGPLGGWRVRAPLAVMAGLLTLFVARMWPEAADSAPEALPAEPATLLSWIVGLPFLGAIAILF